MRRRVLAQSTERLLSSTPHDVVITSFVADTPGHKDTRASVVTGDRHRHRREGREEEGLLTCMCTLQEIYRCSIDITTILIVIVVIVTLHHA